MRAAGHWLTSLQPKALFRENLEQTLNNSRRLAEMTIQVVDEATRTATVQAEGTVQRPSRAA
ncbi:hypothetical protein ACFQY9_34715 [Microvirga aerilata]|uniref:hypothetical protein n=1 Tax=Microvirga aerilata TaxID=670292 RepID=UPI00362A7757